MTAPKTPSLRGRPKKAAAAVLPKLIDSLVLRDFLATQLGGRLDDLMGALKDKEAGRDAGGQSHFLAALQGRAGSQVSVDDLARMDLNVMEHENDLARHRPEFQLLYFQYLSAMVTELFLTLLTRDEAGLLLAVNAFKAAGDYGALPDFTGRDLRTLAFWLATGAGKTLLMHLAMKQFETYAVTGDGQGNHLFTPDARILVTPNAGLTRQHLEEFTASGIQARYYDNVPAGFTGVQVIEITKLRPDSEKPKKSGVTVPVSQFAGANLVLVDEGHKGAATAKDLNDENRWRSLREELAGQDGFTLEYSATFAQVTESDKTGSLLQTYARAVAFEYAYKRFYKDGYGKDFRVLNLKDDADDVMTSRVMLAGLLNLLNKRIAFDTDPEAARTYNLKAPLMVFVGATVTGRDEDSDVPTVLLLLNRVLSDPTWVTAEIDLLLNEKSGMQDKDGRDAVSGSLTQLRGRSASGVYGELIDRIFLGSGGLRLHALRGASGEVALWGASAQAPFGVVKVGDVPGLLKNLKDQGLNVSEDDPLSGSLFYTLSVPGSTVSMLIGSKMFTEGWSNWRVSVMGLLRVGQNAGAQVMQLFGRGVRLLGLQGGLKRSSVLDGTQHPDTVPVQETLDLFGIKANYLQVLLDALGREGVEPTLTREYPIELQTGWEGIGLQIPTPDASYDFMTEIITLDASVVEPIKLLLSTTVEVGRGAGVGTGTISTDIHHLSTVWPLLSTSELLEMARNHKKRKGWHNLYLPESEVLALAYGATLTARPDFLTPKTLKGLSAIQAAANEAVIKGLDTFYIKRQRKEESDRMTVQLLTRDHANFPKVGDEYAYTLKVPESSLTDVNAIITSAKLRLQDASTEPLPRLNFDRHLYAPLLTDHPSKVKLAVKSIPKALEDSEIKFMHHFRSWWQVQHATPPWVDVQIWVLRNLPTTGVGFFQTAGFYPDFLLWVQRGTEQSLAFIDPKGIRQMSIQDAKFQLHTTLESRRTAFGFHVTSFIVASNLATAPLRQQASGTLTFKELADDYHILDLDMAGSYVPIIMDNLRLKL